MASWTKKRGREVVVFIYKDGKRKALPRKVTKHLDSENDYNIDQWLRDYEQTNGLVVKVSSDYNLDTHLASYIAYLKSRNKTYNTYSEHKRHLKNHIIPFFLDHDPPLKDPNHWPSISAKMLAGLQQKGLTSGQIFRCNVALRGFYKWLSDERIILGNGEINLRNPIQTKKETPLQHILTPEEVLDLAEKTHDPDQKVFLLAGYFLSLRPQEIYALKPGDFAAGSTVAGLECTKAMASINLFNKLACNVRRQRTKTQQELKPKAGSGGWVACFDGRGAKMLVEILKTTPRDQWVISKTLNRIYKDWPFEFAVKDLRRASLYWLGHNTDISQNQLMKHARHQSYETTLIYLRRPEETVDDWGLDLEA